MQHSEDRILTTHTGSLPRPDELSEIMVRRESGQLTEAEVAGLPALVRAAVARVVDRQVDAGIDVVSDGEMSKIGYATYVKERLTGFEGEPGALAVADLDDYPGFAGRALAGLVTGTPSCTGPVEYVGAETLAVDLGNLRAALAGRAGGADVADGDVAGVTEAFVPAASPGVISIYLQDHHYGDHGPYLGALAAAMRQEYEAIVAAGFVLQIDAPDLAMGRHVQYSDLSLADYRARLALHVEALNEAIRNIPPDRIRVHLCWGNYEGPHHRDVPLADIVDVVMRVDAQALAFEGANHRHGHEWQVFESFALPDGKLIIPGVIDTSSNYVDHPELVAQRICRYAELVGRERVIAGSDCGFATFASFLPIDPRIAWAKLASLAEGARLATSRLWSAAATPA
jgi:5-methyltetrahydropteroyltriglutamate--homocysteine methyltransferase